MDNNTPSISLYDTLAKEIIRGLEGKNKGILTNTGFIDNNLSGITSGTYTLIGAEPGTGKTSFIDEIYLTSIYEYVKNNNLFDKIVMSEVSEHLPDDVKGLKEVFRVLKKRGTLCLTVPNHNYPLFWDPLNWILEHFINIHVKSGFFAGLWNQHERLYKPQEIEKVTKKAGFKIEEVKSLTWWCLPFNHYMVNLVARGLAAGKFSKDTHLALSKYAKKVKKPLLLNLAFRFVNTLDKLNDVYQPKNFGVSVFVKAVK